MSATGGGRSPRRRRRAILVLAAATAATAWAVNLSIVLPDLKHRFAVRGGSVLDFCYRYMNPELFTRDWPTLPTR